MAKRNKPIPARLIQGSHLIPFRRRYRAEEPLTELVHLDGHYVSFMVPKGTTWDGPSFWPVTGPWQHNVMLWASAFHDGLTGKSRKIIVHDHHGNQVDDWSFRFANKAFYLILAKHGMADTRIRLIQWPIQVLGRRFMSGF